MDNPAKDNTETREHPQREHRLPAYLDDYQVGYQPSAHQAPPATVQRSPSQHSNDSSSRSSNKKKSSSHSRISWSTIHSVGLYPTQGLSNVQAAILEERIKQVELEDLRRLIEHETQADIECRQLDDQAKQAQQHQEEALKAREALATRLERQRRLIKAEQEFEVAKLVSTTLRDDSLTSRASSPAPSDKSDRYLDFPRLFQAGPAHQLPSPSRQSRPTQLASTSTVHLPPPQAMHQAMPVPPAPPVGPPLMLQPPAISAIPAPMAHPVAQLQNPAPLAPGYVRAQPAPPLAPTPVVQPVPHPVSQLIASVPLPSTTPQLAQSLESQLRSGPAPAQRSYSQEPPANSVESRPSALHQPAYSELKPVVEPSNTAQYANYGATPLYSTPYGQQTVPVLPSLYPGYAPLPGAELLLASALGIPRPSLPVFESGQESDFALLKLALDNVLGSNPHLSEQHKYQVLLGHIKLPSALQLAKAYMYDPAPYTHALQALQDKYGQPRQLVQSELGAILNAPAFKMGDANATFALSVQSLVGMLRTLEGQNGYELHCGSHVDRLLSKMPPAYRDSFVEHCLRHGILQTGTDRTYTLQDLATWLQTKSQAKRISCRAAALYQYDTPRSSKKERTAQPKERPVTVGLVEENGGGKKTKEKSKSKPKPYCPHCDSREHFLNACEEFKKLSTEQIVKWLEDGKRCRRCGRNHTTDQCTLKRPCKTCKEVHLTVLHESVQATKQVAATISLASTKVYLDRPNRSPKVMLKVVKVLLHNRNRVMETYAVLDDGSERSIVLPQVVRQLNLMCHPETLPLQTVQQTVKQLDGASVTLEVSSPLRPAEKYRISHAFTSEGLALAEHTYPVAMLQQKYQHLRGLPIPPVNRAQPLILIGSDMPHLITPIQPVHAGPPGGPVAILTQLGWSLQGPVDTVHPSPGIQQCLLTTTAPNSTELLRNVERLWQMDTLPYSEKVVTRSKEDQRALTLLRTATTRVAVDGVSRYATPLLRRTTDIALHAPKEAVLPRLRSTERKLAKNPTQAESYRAEIRKLKEAGYVTKVSTEEASKTSESWFIPHHMVHHNGKDRVVFDCSFQYRGQSLNELLLPGPTLGPSLLGVLLRFRQHSVAVSGDIKAMFHQIRLQPSDKPTLRFIWRDMQTQEEPTIYEWQVLPFGTTCSPCCAVFALQRHVQDNCGNNSNLSEVVERSFYVDNCLHSTCTTEEAKVLVDNLRQLLLEGGFNLRQWASNKPEVVEHLPPEAKSECCELWLSKGSNNLQESTLGLQWNCLNDSLGYKLRPADTLEPTLRNIYKALASQYDPLGFIIPFTTMAKVLIQDIWKQEIGWDDPIEPQALREQWTAWVGELPDLIQLEFPRTYVPPCADKSTASRELHVFCDASERAYGSVAYLRTMDDQSHVHCSFMLARSRVAPKKRLSMPRLELSAALTGAQLAKLIQTELTIPIQQVFLWSDSTTVLQWLRSESCRYKVFVGTRVAEIQTLTDVASWRYVDSARNPADDITRGLSLSELAHPHRWTVGPDFLHQPPDQWPTMPTTEAEPDVAEIRKSTFVGFTAELQSPDIPDPTQFDTWKDLVQTTVSSPHGAAALGDGQTTDADAYILAEKLLLARAQQDSFPHEIKALKASRPLPNDSRLAALSPEYDEVTGLLRVGGRLRHADLEADAIHPIILDPAHQIVKLLIQDFDDKLLHPGPERVLAEMRRQYWLLRGREAVRKHQHSCKECRHWRAKPDVPKMADLPPSRLRIYKPPFYSTGVDCFGPFTVKIGRRTEKRWGIVYKCLTTRCVHLDLLEHLDTDAFLLSLRRFIARRGTPFELLCDNGTNFVGGERELREAFNAMAPQLQEQLAKQKISFQFNPPSAPHFGGAWEREVRSVKTALRVVLKEQSVPEPVLQTVLIEVEGILNAKPLGYVSADAADPDPITPNVLLMGRRDSSLPQALYDSSRILGTRRWRHSQVLADNFWSTFIRRYLPTLQGRPKWRTDGDQLTADQVVLIVDPQLPRALWPVGRVTETYPGADGRIRTASVKVKDKTYVRPVARLIRLPKISDSEEMAN